eukprot:tig00000507_g1781.t1
MAGEGVPFSSPVSMALYPTLATLFMGVGLLLLASFFVYEVTSNKYTRKIEREGAIAAGASVFLGFGIVFLLNSQNVFV